MHVDITRSSLALVAHQVRLPQTSAIPNNGRPFLVIPRPPLTVKLKPWTHNPQQLPSLLVCTLQTVKPGVLSQALVRNKLKARPSHTLSSAQQPHLLEPTLQPQRAALTVQLPPGQALVHGIALLTTEEVPFLLQYVLSDLLPLAPNGCVMDLSAGGSARQGVVTALAGLQLLPVLDGTVAEFKPAVTAQQRQQGLGAQTRLYLPANDTETLLLRSCGEMRAGPLCSCVPCQSTCTHVFQTCCCICSWMLSRLRLSLLSMDCPNNASWLVSTAFGWCSEGKLLVAAHAKETLSSMETRISS